MFDKITIVSMWLWTLENSKYKMDTGLNSALPGFYSNPGVRQSRSARFGVKRTEDDALKIVPGWMFAQHEEALKRAQNLSKGFNLTRYHWVESWPSLPAMCDYLHA